jgi:hypothetical protein
MNVSNLFLQSHNILQKHASFANLMIFMGIEVLKNFYPMQHKLASSTTTPKQRHKRTWTPQNTILKPIIYVVGELNNYALKMTQLNSFQWKFCYLDLKI